VQYQNIDSQYRERSRQVSVPAEADGQKSVEMLMDPSISMRPKPYHDVASEVRPEWEGW